VNQGSVRPSAGEPRRQNNGPEQDGRCLVTYELMSEVVVTPICDWWRTTPTGVISGDIFPRQSASSEWRCQISGPASPVQAPLRADDNMSPCFPATHGVLHEVPCGAQYQRKLGETEQRRRCPEITISLGERRHDSRKEVVEMDTERFMNLARLATRAPGGFSINLAGREPIRRPDWFMVSLAGYEYPCERRPGMDEDEVVEYIVAHQHQLLVPGRYLGSWLEAGTRCLDISVAVHGRDRALALARKNSQKAVFDLGLGKCIYLKDLVLVPEFATLVAEDVGRASTAPVWGAVGLVRGPGRLIGPDTLAPYRSAS
jgi:hypothetical protein